MRGFRNHPRQRPDGLGDAARRLASSKSEAPDPASVRAAAHCCVWNMRPPADDSNDDDDDDDVRRARSRTLPRPRGRAPRGFSWDAALGVWRNDENDTVQSKKERHAKANREYRWRTKPKKAAAPSQAHGDENEAAEGNLQLEDELSAHGFDNRSCCASGTCWRAASEAGSN